MADILLPGLAELQSPEFRSEQLPPISERYADVLGGLVLRQDKGVTHFRGGPLDLGPDKSVWMSPIEVDDGRSISNFQIFYVNARPEQLMGVRDTPVTLLDIDETSYKLVPKEHPTFGHLMDRFMDDQPHVYVRHAKRGMNYYPRVATPHKDKERIADHTDRLLRAVELPTPQLRLDLSMYSQNRTGFRGIEGINHITQARTYEFGSGKVHSYGIILPDDQWQYYEIFTTRPLEHMIDCSADDNILVRIDSGCDTGQLFGDRGCECREQLHDALHSMQTEEKNNGIIIHIPSQDGRGYGVVTKMETEIMKQGLVRVKGKAKLGVVETVDTNIAAKALLGDNYDIRDYFGAGKILNIFGFTDIRLLTDNNDKVNHLRQMDITVEKVPTGTTGEENGCEEHVQAKLRLKKYGGTE